MGEKVKEEIVAETVQDYTPSFISLLASFLPSDISEEQSIELINQFFTKKKLKK
jgi:hypothetical protein